MHYYEAAVMYRYMYMQVYISFHLYLVIESSISVSYSIVPRQTPHYTHTHIIHTILQAEHFFCALSSPQVSQLSSSENLWPLIPWLSVNSAVGSLP